MVRFWLDDVEVFFPYDYVYPEQFEYMRQLKACLDAKGHCVLEMPTGTGKTVTLMSLITSYQLAHPETGKLIYCTRTVPEMEKALEELSVVVNYQMSELARDIQFVGEHDTAGTVTLNGRIVTNSTCAPPLSPGAKPADSGDDKGTEEPIGSPSTKRARVNEGSENHNQRRQLLQSRKLLGLGMTSRRNLCIHPEISREADRDKIDERCNVLTAPWIRRKRQARPLAPSAAATTSATSALQLASQGTSASLTPSCPASTSRNARDIEDLIPHTNGTPSSDPSEGCPTRSVNHETSQLEPLGGSSCASSSCCPYYDNFEALWSPSLVPSGVYTIESMKHLGANWHHPGFGRRPFCPYFASRRLVEMANVVVLNYQYLLDPKVSQVIFVGRMNVAPNVGVAATLPAAAALREAGLAPSVDRSTSTHLSKDPSVVVFDEAHNIDNVCIEAFSININMATLERARQNIARLERDVTQVKSVNADRLLEEYNRLVHQLRAGGALEADESVVETLGNPVLPQDVVQEAVPGTIRRAEFFLQVMKKLVVFLSTYIRVFVVKTEGPLTFLKHVKDETLIDTKSLKFCYERLKSLLTTLEVVSLEEFLPLSTVANFFTLLGTYWEGFILITDPYPEAEGIYSPVVQLSCLDASLAMRPVLEKFQSVVLTSGTISPLFLYPKLLGFHPVITQSFPMSLDRNCICPLIISRSADQVPLSSRFDMRSDEAVLRNFGTLLVELVKTVPDGMVCFFPSYAFMEIIVAEWYSTGILAEVLRHKLVLMETKDVIATTLALHSFRKACDCGRGAVFLSVARGKVAEGIDFDRHYGRAVVLFGIPYQYSLSRILKARLDYLRENYQVPENEFLTFDAMRQAAQCVGRIIRSKTDYGLMIFADCRYNRLDKRQKLPEWILRHLEPANMNLTTDAALAVAHRFLLEMSQPLRATNKSRLGPESLGRLTAKATVEADKAE